MTKKANLLIVTGGNGSSRVAYFAYSREGVKTSAYGSAQTLELNHGRSHYYLDRHPKCNGTANFTKRESMLQQAAWFRKRYKDNVSLVPMELLV